MSRCIYDGITKRNIYYQNEIRKITETLSANGIISIPVKGAMLLPEMYKDFGIRYSGDADFLIRHGDVKILEKILYEKLGYIKGEYNIATNMIEPVSRMEDVKWKMYMSNLFPYCKVVDEEDFNLKYIKLDYRFALDDTLCYDIVDDIVDFYEAERHAKPAHILTHLCTHFYDEAKHTMTIAAFKDLNLIKLCDIREYIHQFVDKSEWEDLFKFVRKYNLEKQVYYAMYWISLVYNDGYEGEIMQKLRVDDVSFLDTFGKNTITEQRKYRKSALERLFSCDNTLELEVDE